MNLVKKIVDYPPIGKIEVCTKRNCNGIRYVVSEKYVRIYTAPSLLKNVFPIPNDKIQWILQHKTKFEKQAEKKFFFYNIDTELDTFFFKLKFAVEPKLVNKFSAKMQNNVATMFIPVDFDFQKPQNQSIIKNVLKHFLTIEAKKNLPEKVSFFAEKYNFKFSEVKITSARSRWGSCNNKKRIALSCFLLLLPKDLIDMVIIHELCHTEQMNHGAKFYSRLRAILPNLDQLNKAIKIEEKRIKEFI